MMNLIKLAIMKLFKMAMIFSLLALVSCNMFASDSKKEGKAAGTSAKIISLTSSEFKEKVFDYENYEKEDKQWQYAGSLPAIIDFYADWCGPCRRLAPILAELAEEYAGKIVIYKVDVDAQKEVAAFFGVNSIPMMLFVPMKGEPQIGQGLMPKENLKKAIDSFLLDDGKK